MARSAPESGDDALAPPLMWRFGVVLSLLTIASFFAIDSVLYRDSVYIALPLFGIVGVLAAMRRYRPDPSLPWVLLVAALAVYIVANGIYLYYNARYRGPPPYPSPADAFFIFFQLLSALSIVSIIVARGTGRRRQLIDSAIVGAVVAMLGWVFLAKPYFDVGEMSAAAGTVTLLYQVVYVFNAAVVTHQIMSPGGRVFAVRVMETSFTMLLLGLVGYSALSAVGGYQSGHLIDALILLGVAGLALAGMHPTIARVSQVADVPSPLLGPGRLMFYAIALLVVPFALLLVERDWARFEVIALTLASVTVTGLVVVRLARTVREVESSEIALAASEARFRTLVEEMPGVVYLTEAGAHGSWFYVSPQIEGLLGHPAQAWLDDPSLWLESVVPEDRDEVLERETRYSEEWTEFVADYRMRRADGSVIWVRDRARRLPGQREVWQGILSDVTAQREAEEELQLIHEYYAALIQNSSDVINVVGRDAHIIFSSDSMISLTGFEPADVVGRNAVDLLHPDDRSGAEKTLRSLLDESAAEAMLEGRLACKDGGWVWAEIHARNALSDPAVDGVILSVRDVSRRKRDEQRVETSEARKTAMLEAALDAIVSMDHQGRVLEFNAAAERVFGYRAEATLGRPVAELLVPPHLRDRHSKGLRRHLETGHTSILGRRLELEALRADGTTFPAEIAISRAESEGKPFFTAFIRDLTQQKLEESEREQLQLQAERSQRLDSVGKLAGGIAHDFNNILAVIQNYAIFVQEALPSDDPAREDCKEIIGAARRAADMTRQLLVFSRRESAQPESLDLNDVVTGIHQMLRRAVRENIDFRLDLAADLSKTLGDRSRMEQVLLNLVVNARDSMPSGGCLTVSTKNLESRIEDRERTPAVSLSVSDTGCGIPETLRERIFEPFFTTKERTGGTGLGLATVYGIVKEAGGDIAVSSEVGSGTTFTITLPALDQDPLPSTSLSGTGQTAVQTGYRVLVVEDEPAVRESVVRLLERAGFAVTAPSSAREAVALHERGELEIDVLLTDVIMPDLSGREVSARIGAPTVFMSGYAREGRLDESALVVQKPFELQTLVEALDRAVRGSR